MEIYRELTASENMLITIIKFGKLSLVLQHYGKDVINSYIGFYVKGENKLKKKIIQVCGELNINFEKLIRESIRTIFTEEQKFVQKETNLQMNSYNIK